MLFALKYLISTAPGSGGAFNIPRSATSFSTPTACATPKAMATLSGNTKYLNFLKYDSGISFLSTTISSVLRFLASLAKKSVNSSFMTTNFPFRGIVAVNA